MAKGPLQGELSSAAWARGAQSSPQAWRDGDEKTERRVEMETQGGGRRRAPVGSGCPRRAARPAWGTAGRGEGASASGGLTRVVSAASRGGAPPPVPVHLGELPLLVGISGEGVGGQVADLQAGIVPQEVAEGHPGKARHGHPGYSRAHG